MPYTNKFDVIVIGAGHAGVEAALAAGRMQAKTLLVTQSIETIGMLSCNPAIGGIGKGHLVKEIDALGGAMGDFADAAGIQWRILNSRKGPAVRATRAQADRSLYKAAVRKKVEFAPNVTLFQQAVDDLIVVQDQVVGIVTQGQVRFYAHAVVLTVGTFLGGKIHIGTNNFSGGRAGDPPSIPLAGRLREMPFRVARLKTGTPPRIDVRTIDLSKLVVQAGDPQLPKFSVWNKVVVRPEQVNCYIAQTNAATHAIIEKNLHRSAMYSGNIEGVGPRYCPSIEDKVVRFKERSSHQIFIEPEGLNSIEVYPNGISTSLPFDVQLELLHSMKGFANAVITRPGYAIEYDYFDPRDLKPNLESKNMQNLFFAGQINGTTGYEEAAAQGILAGINAALVSQDKPMWYPKRSEAYLGVLVDDLITQGTTEPYRMFTSRAEYRLTLREDNADQRLSPIAQELGLLDEQKWQMFNNKMAAIAKQTEYLTATILHPGTLAATQVERFLDKKLEREYKAIDLLKRPEILLKDLLAAINPAIICGVDVSLEVIEQVEIATKYAGYILQQAEEIAKMANQEQQKIPFKFNYRNISGLSKELCEKLENVRPATIGQASRIPGMTPAAISLLLVFIKKHQVLESYA